MIVMLDTNQDLEIAEREMGYPCERLIVPGARPQTKNRDQYFALDNGAFTNFDARAFRRLLNKEKSRRHLCRFVAAPDVVGSALRTLECFDHWRAELTGWPIALVCQDGQEDLPIPWNRIQAVFIGGTTAWKESRYTTQIIKAAQVIGKWVHVGRVNTPARVQHFVDLGVDSFDGSGIARYTHMREAIRDYKEPITLFNGERYANAEST